MKSIRQVLYINEVTFWAGFWRNRVSPGDGGDKEVDSIALKASVGGDLHVLCREYGSWRVIVCDYSSCPKSFSL